MRSIFPAGLMTFFFLLAPHSSHAQNALLEAKVTAMCNEYGSIAVVMWNSKLKRKPSDFVGKQQSIVEATYKALQDSMPKTKTDAFMYGYSACRDEFEQAVQARMPGR